MVKRLPVITIYLLLGLRVFSQPNTFLKIYYNYPHHHVAACIAEGDGGYIIDFAGASIYDDLLIKTDSAGNELLIDTLCSNGGISLKKTLDSNFVFVTTTKTPCSYIASNGYDIKVYKINKNIDTIWTSVIGTIYDEYGFCTLPLTNGKYLIGGATSGFDNLFKIDSAGNFISSHLIPMEWIYSIIEDSEGNLVFCGYLGDGVPNSWAVIKTDSSITNILWAKYYGTTGGFGDQYFSDLVQLPDSNYLLGGVSPGFLIMKADKNTGDSLWSNSTPGAITSIDVTLSGNYITAGDYRLRLLNDTGGIVWIKSYTNVGTFRSIKTTADGGFIACGSGGTMTQGGPLLLKTDSLGNFATAINDLKIRVLNYSLYPNPVTTQSRLEFGNLKHDKFVFTLYDITGREIESATTQGDNFIITKGSKQSGIYFFKLENSETGVVQNGKLMIK